MGTRSGTIDPAVVKYLMETKKMNLKDIDEYLNKKSGVLGISGVSSDFRDLERLLKKEMKGQSLRLIYSATESRNTSVSMLPL
jgi:acetate kinase